MRIQKKITLVVGLILILVATGWAQEVPTIPLDGGASPGRAPEVDMDVWITGRTRRAVYYRVDIGDAKGANGSLVVEMEIDDLIGDLDLRVWGDDDDYEGPVDYSRNTGTLNEVAQVTLEDRVYIIKIVPANEVSSSLVSYRFRVYFSDYAPREEEGFLGSLFGSSRDVNAPPEAGVLMGNGTYIEPPVTGFAVTSPPREEMLVANFPREIKQVLATPDGERLVVVTWAPNNVENTVYSYNLETGKVTRLGEAQGPVQILPSGNFIFQDPRGVLVVVDPEYNVRVEIGRIHDRADFSIDAAGSRLTYATFDDPGIYTVRLDRTFRVRKYDATGWERSPKFVEGENAILYTGMDGTYQRELSGNSEAERISDGFDPVYIEGTGWLVAMERDDVDGGTDLYRLDGDLWRERAESPVTLAQSDRVLFLRNRGNFTYDLYAAPKGGSRETLLVTMVSAPALAGEDGNISFFSRGRTLYALKVS